MIPRFTALVLCRTSFCGDDAPTSTAIIHKLITVTKVVGKVFGRGRQLLLTTLACLQWDHDLLLNDRTIVLFYSGVDDHAKLALVGNAVAVPIKFMGIAANANDDKPLR